MNSSGAVVAIVDDDAALAAGISELIRSLGHSATVFTSAQALLSANLDDFDCVLSDVQMPGMSGLVLLKMLRQDRPSIPVILITAFYSEAIRVEASAGGAICLLNKPFDDSELEACINKALV